MVKSVMLQNISTIHFHFQVFQQLTIFNNILEAHIKPKPLLVSFVKRSIMLVIIHLPFCHHYHNCFSPFCEFSNQSILPLLVQVSKGCSTLVSPISRIIKVKKFLNVKFPKYFSEFPQFNLYYKNGRSYTYTNLR